MVDEAYLDRDEWIKKSIRTTAKVGTLITFSDPLPLTCIFSDGQVQLGPSNPGLRSGILEHREHQSGLDIKGSPKHLGLKQGVCTRTREESNVYVPASEMNVIVTCRETNE